MAEAAPLPTADEFFGPKQELPTADEFFAKPYRTLPGIERAALGALKYGIPGGTGIFGGMEPYTSNEATDNYLQHAPVGHVLSAFGQGFKEGWGSEPLGLSDQSEQELRKAGIFNDYTKGHFSFSKAFNEAWMRPAAVALDTFLRGSTAAFRGAQAATQQVGAETGQPQLGRDIAAMPEAFFGTPHPLGMPPVAETPMPAELARARSLGVIGEGEAGWKGTFSPQAGAHFATEEQAALAQRESMDAALKERAAAGEPVAAPGLPEATAPAPAVPDIHAAAREIAPDVFKDFDALAARKETFRRWIDELRAGRDERVAQEAPHGDELADLKAKIDTATPRLAKKYQARIDEMQAAREDYIDEHTRGDSADMAKIRQRLMQTDYAMRDLSPQVAKAYQEARAKMPEAAEAEPAAQPPQTETPPIAEDAKAAPAAAAAPEEAKPAVEPVAAAEQQPTVPVAQTEAAPASPEKPSLPEHAAPPLSIADDVSKKLVAAGRPQEEADAAAQLIASHYEARAARFNGSKGTAADLYRADAPEIKAGRTKARAKELAQSSRPGKSTRPGKINIVEESRNTITLFKDADASTFLHETGHQWLEELMQDAGDSAAPADLLADAKTVRDWLGAKEGEGITRAQHERFARGFETYLMEGRAPSTALARVFEQFRQWLTAIYQTVARLKSPINDDIRDVFDRLVTVKPERVTVAPERPVAKGFAELHEAEAEAAHPAEAHEIAERISAERDRAAAEGLTEEEQNARLAGVAEEAGRREPRGQEPDRARPVAEPELREGGTGEEPGTLGAGGTEAAQEGAGSREKSGVERGAQETGLPKLAEPKAEKRQSLLEFLRARGGLKPNPELNAIFGYNKLDLVRKNGMSLDRAREAAVEAGYLHDEGAISGAESTSTINDLLDLLDSEGRGNKVYRYGEKGEAAAAFRGERDRLEGELKAEIQSLGGDLKEIPKSIRDRALFLMYAEGSDPLAAYEKAVMEADYYAEQTGQYRREETNVIPDESFGAPGAGEPYPRREGIGNAGETARDVGGPDREADPNAILGRPETDLIDKAGNIRLDNLNTPEDINTILKAFADENGGFMDQRGVVSDAQVLDLADAMGVQATALNMKKFAETFGQGQLSAKVMKLRQMVVESAVKVREAMAKAATGTDVDVMAYAKVKARHQMIQGTLSAVTAEAGRALRAFHEIEGLKEAQAIGDFLRDTTGRTLYQLRQEAQLGMNLGTPEQVSKFVHDSAKPTFGDMLLEYWINGLISGPATHTTYSVGNALLALWKAGPETAGAAVVGGIRHALGGEGPRVMMGEVPAQLYGLMRGMRNGVNAAWESVKTGRTTMLPGELENMTARQLQLSPLVNPRASIPNFTIGGVPVPLGTLARIPSRGIAAIHSFFRAVNYEREMAGLAYRQAEAEGLEGDALARRIGEIETSPGEDLMKQARRSATDLTLMGKGGELTTALTRLTNARFFGGQWLKFIDPFVHISSNVIEQAVLQRTVLGVVSHEVRADLSGANGPIARDMVIARMAVGTGLSVAVGSLAAEGLINGSGPSDPKERAIWTMVNGPPHSVRIGDTWYDIHRLGPLGMQVGIAADLYSVAHMASKEDMSKVASQLMHAFTQNILDESFMRGPSDLIKALTDHERYGPSYVRNFLSSFVPYSVGMGQVARGLDPYSRSARTLMDSVKAKVPWLSETLLPRVDVFGQPVPNKSALGVAGLSAIYETKVVNDPAARAMLDLGIFPAMPQRHIRGVELTDQQYYDYATMAGQMAKMRIDSIVAMPGFDVLPPAVRREMITKSISGAREAARSLVMMQNPQIIQQAVDNKIAVLTTGKKPTRH